MGLSMSGLFYFLLGIIVGLFIGSKSFRNKLVSMMGGLLKKKPQTQASPQIKEISGNNYNSVVDSLVAMGFGIQDIRMAVNYAIYRHPNGTTAELMREALSKLGNNYKPPESDKREIHIHVEK